MTYKYGAYGHIKESVAQAASTGGTAMVYVGVAPVNLARGYAASKVVNFPKKIINFTNAQATLGLSKDWDTFTLCEAIEAHFNNKKGNIGPIYAINVLDPDLHRTTTSFSHSVKVTFKDSKAVVKNAGMIDLEDLALDSLVSGTDYKAEKDGENIVLTDLKGALTSVVASYTGTGKLATLTTTNGRVDLLTDKIILDSISVFDKEGNVFVEDTDYSINYNFTTNAVIISGANLPKEIVVTYAEVDPSKITKTDIIGAAIDGEYTGLYAVKLLYQELNTIISGLGCPGFSHIPEVYNAMCTTVDKLNGHWDGMVFADAPIVDDDATAPQTIEKAIEWKKTNGYDSERSHPPFWPKAINASGQIFHGSTLAMVEQMRINIEHDDIPMESFGNKTVPIVGLYFGKNSKAKGFDKEEANLLTAAGLATFTYWGGSWVLWGDHTAAYEYGKDIDPRANFGVTMQMLFHITNSFQKEWGPKVDKPMTVRLKDEILNREQEKLDALVNAGALLGSPTVLFLESENSTEDIIQGNFKWDFGVTVTPPLKAPEARVAYTTDGFSAYFNE